ncbi:MAG: hypothetical protein WDA07_06160 [Leucobacter sp.]
MKTLLFTLSVFLNFLGIIGAIALILFIDTGLWRIANARALWSLIGLSLLGAVVLTALFWDGSGE